MTDEFELKFLDIDKDAMIKKIESLDAEKKYDVQIIEYTLEKEGFSRKDSTKNIFVFEALVITRFSHSKVHGKNMI